jgi:hypothetical protein
VAEEVGEFGVAVAGGVGDVGLEGARHRPGLFQRWRDGQMALRWCAAGMIEASKRCRRLLLATSLGRVVPVLRDAGLTGRPAGRLIGAGASPLASGAA